MVAVSIAVVMVVTLLFGAGTIEKKANAIGDARKQAVELDERLRLYRLANPDCTDTTAVSGKD